MNKFFNKKIQNFKRGFTLVEMMVVAGIFAVLTMVVIFRYGDFTSNLLVTNMAYEIALTTRQAQIFGLGVRGYNNAGEKVFNYPYGVFFNVNDGSTGTLGQTKMFSFFVDRNNDNESGYGQCNSSNGSGDCVCASGDECIEQLTLQRNIRITQLRVSSSSNVCETNLVDKLAITFQRPSPEARIEWQTYNTSGYEFAQIKVEATGSKIKPAYVLIRKNGQISVSANDICNLGGNNNDNGNNQGDSNGDSNNP